MKKFKKHLILWLLCGTLTLSPIAISQARAETGVGYVAGSAFSSLIYTPIKFASALIMGIGGGLSLMGTIPAGAEQESIKIVKTGMSGDWWVSPEHLSGRRQFKFIEPVR